MDSDDHPTQVPGLSNIPDEGGGRGSRAAPRLEATEMDEQPKPAADLAGRDSGSTATQTEINPPEKVKKTRERKPKAASAKPKGRPKGKAKSASPPERQKDKKEDEDVCFICFDGGDLVLCDHRGCPKAYHPACIKRDRSFFRCKAKWNCGWHICSSCQKRAHYLCYTCTYSVCKSCVKGADYICLRETKGLCGTCRKTIMLIENFTPGNEEKVQVDFDDQGSWEYLFKLYWADLKEKLSLTTYEVIQAKNPKRQRKRKRRESIEQVQNGHVKPGKAGRGNEQLASFCQSTAWASNELLEFVAFMKNGDKSVISRFDVQALLLEYISRNNLHDPRQKWQIFCDGRLSQLFGKASLDQFEMLKLLDSHFHVKENSQVDGYNKQMLGNAVTGHIGIDLNNDKQLVATDQKNENCQHFGERVMINQDCSATKDPHYNDLKFVCRNVVESLIGDSKFSEKVIGSVIRIRTSNNDQKQEIYRMAQVIGTCKAGQSYKIGDKTTNIKLEIQNLDKKELVTIDEISNQDFTEGEWRYLDQSIRCGAMKWHTKDEILQNTMMLKSEKVEEREATVVLNCWNSAKNHTAADAVSSFHTTSGNVSEISPSPLSTATELSVNDNETCKMWQYQDPNNGKIQGPFTMSQMRKWRTVGELPLDLRIWGADEKREDSIPLADAALINGHGHHFTNEQRTLLSHKTSEMSSISTVEDTNRVSQNNILKGNNNHESSEMGSCFSGSSPVDVESAANMAKSESLNSLGRFNQCNVNLNCLQKQCDGDGISSQSSGQNWKALSPVISSSNDGSKLQQKKGIIDFLDSPHAALESGQTNRGVVKLEQWDSTATTTVTTTVVSFDGATLTLGNSAPDPVPTASSWQAMLLEPVEITSLPEEAVSDLLAELEASEPPPPLSSSSNNKNDGLFNLEADFFPILSPSTIRNELPLGFGGSERMMMWHEPNHFLGSQMADPTRWGAMQGGVSHGYRNVYLEPVHGGGGGIAGQGNVHIFGGGSDNSNSNNNRYGTTTSPRDQFFEGLNLDLGRGSSFFWDSNNWQ